MDPAGEHDDAASYDGSGVGSGGEEAWAETSAVQTGVPAVDAVIDAVAGLGERPLNEHVAVFESAQEQLRRALDVPDPTA